MSVTTENYLKAIFAASESTERELVSLGDLAHALNVTPGTVTTMMKNLADAGLVEYRPRLGVMLTGEGRDAALSVVRRHRLVELFLVEVIGLDWSLVHAEAEELEHVISDRLLNRIDELLDHPATDPHGDPIPTVDGSLPNAVGRPLAEMKGRGTYRISRVKNDDPRFLKYLKATGFVPGAEVELVERSDDAGTVVIRTEANEHVISLQVAQRLRVVASGARSPTR